MFGESKSGGGERYYWPRYHTLHEDGTLTLKVTGYEEDTRIGLAGLPCLGLSLIMTSGIGWLILGKYRK